MNVSVVTPAAVGRQREKGTRFETPAASWQPLYTIAGVAALLAVACIAVAIVVFVVNPPPTKVADWFKLYHDNAVLGTLDADLMMLTSFLLMGVIYLALFGALRRASEPFMALALGIGFVSIAGYMSANPAFGMLSLSNQYYAAATTAAERSQLLAAGQGILANWTGSAFDVSYLLSGVAMLTISMVMLRSGVFSRATAYIGLVIGVGGLVPVTAGMVGIVASFITLVPTVIWLGLVARRFFQLGGATANTSAITDRAVPTAGVAG